MVDVVDLEFASVVTDTPVSLNVVIGDGQIGGSAVKLDGELLAKPGAVNKLHLGNGSELVGKVLDIKTLVADVNDATNFTSVTYEFDGVAPSPITARHRVENNGDGVIYRTKFLFEPEQKEE